MNLKAVWVPIAALVMLVSPASGQERVFECGAGKNLSASEVAKLVGEIQTHYSAIKNFTASFLQSSYLAALDTSELSSGKVYYLKPGKMKWEYLEPERQTFLTDAENLWLYQPEQNQVFIDSFSTAFNSDVPLSFLLGIGNLERDFRAESACRAADGIVVTLHEKNKTDDKLGELQLLIHYEKKIPVGARIVDVGGNVTAILFKDLDTQVEISPEAFKADFPAGTDRIDRRKAE